MTSEDPDDGEELVTQTTAAPGKLPSLISLLFKPLAGPQRSK